MIGNTANSGLFADVDAAGGTGDSTNGGGQLFNGEIDEVASYNAQLNSQDIQNQVIAGGLRSLDDYGYRANPIFRDRPIVGAITNHDASLDDGGAIWSDTVTPNAGFSADVDTSSPGVTFKADAQSSASGIISAWMFDGSGGAPYVDDSLHDRFGDGITEQSASFEIWFRPSDLAGDEVLWETGGGGDGSSFRLTGDLFQFVTSNNNDNNGDATVQQQLDDVSDFIQAVAVLDFESDEVRLFIDGELADVQTGYLGEDWDGGDDGGFGDVFNSLGGGLDTGFETFAGDISLFRFYGFPLSDEEVLQNFNAGAAVPEPASIAMWLLLGSLGFSIAMRHRRRKAMRS